WLPPAPVVLPLEVAWNHRKHCRLSATSRVIRAKVGTAYSASSGAAPANKKAPGGGPGLSDLIFEKSLFELQRRTEADDIGVRAQRVDHAVGIQVTLRVEPDVLIIDAGDPIDEVALGKHV